MLLEIVKEPSKNLNFGGSLEGVVNEICAK
jgi:hypothetical protein